MLYDSTALYLTFCLHVRALQKQFPLSVSSWWRSTKRNAHVAGHPNSFHLQGLGADLVLDDPAETTMLIIEARALGLQAIDEGHHVHVELDYRAP